MPVLAAPPEEEGFRHIPFSPKPYEASLKISPWGNSSPLETRGVNTLVDLLK